MGLRHCAKRDDADFDLVDVADFNLPLLDESMPAMFGQYSLLYQEWTNKAALANPSPWSLTLKNAISDWLG